MLASSTEMSNQLKLNLDALVSNLNLVNIIQQPKPIVIENVNNKIFSNYSHTQRNANNSFNHIDEDKLKMFSFLAERKLKEQEWHSKYFDSSKKDSKEAPVTNKKKPINNKNTRIDSSFEKKNAADKIGNKKTEILFNVIPLDVKLAEMSRICKHLMSAVDTLESVLLECKFFDL